MSIFGVLEQQALRASALANDSAAKVLTGKFRQHLLADGHDREQVNQCQIVYDSEQDQFLPEVHQDILNASLGDEENPPTGTITRFFNHVDVAEVHKKALLAEARKAGLA